MFGTRMRIGYALTTCLKLALSGRFGDAVEFGVESFLPRLHRRQCASCVARKKNLNTFGGYAKARLQKWLAATAFVCSVPKMKTAIATTLLIITAVIALGQFSAPPPDIRPVPAPVAQPAAPEAPAVAMPEVSALVNTPLPGEAETQAAFISAIVAFIVQQLKKRVTLINPKVLVLAPAVVSLLISYALHLTGSGALDPRIALIIGLSANGVYDVAKKLVPGMNETPDDKIARLKAELQKLQTPSAT